MSHALEFIETSLFTRQIKSIASDDELKDLQKELIAWPDKGDVIQHTGGLRKIRMAAGLKGKRGGARVIYFLATGRGDLSHHGLSKKYEGHSDRDRESTA
ncbi:Uncharacterised protein [Enterobacter cancerogenus]|uniref:Addiction module toxin RelE n=1 Tax=Enterobacter cancerogenus TaxID=69218 RepID=A0A484YT95_9ENTR|nr:Uncharacterised protein [Enterobacter cancerogenus]